MGVVPRVLIGIWSDHNPASDPSVLLPKADEITVWATHATRIDPRLRRCVSQQVS